MQTQVIKVKDRTITVRELLAKDLPEFSYTVEPMLTYFDDMVHKSEGNPSANQLFRFCTSYSPDVIKLCALMTDADKEFLRNLPPADLFLVAKKVIELSGDFFLIQIAQPIVEMSNAMRNLAQQITLTTLVQDTGLSVSANGLSGMDTNAPTL